VIDAGEVATQLTLDKLVGDHTYLNMIVDAWRRCQEVPRTSMAAEEKVSIHVHETATGRKSILRFPDLSGESFEHQFESRRCAQAYVDSYEDEGGIMLFVNADRITDGLTVGDLAPAVVGEPPIANGDPAPWTPKAVPEQVRLVELLQFLQRSPFARRKRRLALAVSAWDAVATPQLEPEEWVRREMPFLCHFLMNNTESFETRFYGISAQGGDVKGANRQALLQRTPSQRIQCIGPEVALNDLTAPLIWLDGVHAGD
jgi:hypothetical protein